MTESEREAFADLLFFVAEGHGETLSPGRVEFYFAALSDLDLAAIRAALDTLARHVKFFPKPAEIRDAIEGTAEERAERAWVALLQMVRRCGSWWQGPLPWPDATTERAALDLYGGWRRLCEHLPASGPEFLGTAKHFKLLFCAYDMESPSRLAEQTRITALRQHAIDDVKTALRKIGQPTGGLDGGSPH